MGMARVALVLAGFSACNGGVAPVTDGPIVNTTLLSGTACTTPVSYVLGGDEHIAVNFTPAGLIDLVAVLDGDFFSGDSEIGWQTYAAAQHDTYLMLAFDAPEPATPHQVTAIFDSLFGGRGTGVIGFVEHGMGENVVITAIDTAAKTIAIEFTLPIYGYASGYPPNFATFDECMTGSVAGAFRGSYELASF